MYGWRARLGLIVPSTNSVNEPEFYNRLPEGVDLYTARMKLDEEAYRTENAEKSLDSMNKQNLDRAAELVSDPNIDVVIYGCTSGSFLKGLTYDENIKQRLHETTGVPAVTTASSLKEALEALAIDSLVITTPYIPEMNERAKKYFEEAGFNVIKASGLGIDNVGSSRSIQSHGSLTPERAYREAKSINVPAADGILISCTNYDVLDSIPKLENDLNKPVVTSNQAMIWNALRKTDVDPSTIDTGMLFDI